MKRTDLIRHLLAYGCVLVRDTGPHAVYRNAKNAHQASVPRHREIASGTARVICQQLMIPAPDKK